MTNAFVEKGQAVRRFDLAPISGKTWKIDPETGFLHADVALTWTGVRTYVHADGTTTRELRRPETVLDAESLASLERLPITRGHPPQFVTAKTIDSVQVGYTGDTIRIVDIDGYKTPISRATITNQDVINDIVEKGLTQTSLGYSMVPRGPREDEAVHDAHGQPLKYGIWLGPHGPEEYDIEHTFSRGNHEAAAIQAGRGGAEIGFKLDAQDAVMDNPDGVFQKPCIRKDAYMVFDKKAKKFLVHQGNTGRFLKAFDDPLEAQDYVDMIHRKTNPKIMNRGSSARERNYRRTMKDTNSTVQHTIKVGDGPSALTVNDYLLEGLPQEAAVVISDFVKSMDQKTAALLADLESVRGIADGLKQKADEQSAEIAKLMSEIATSEEAPASEEPTVTVDDIRKRIKLIDSAKRVLCVDELDDALMSMPEKALKAEVVRRACGDAEVGSSSDEYLSGRFDALVMFSSQKQTKTDNSMSVTTKIDWLPSSKTSHVGTDFIRQAQARLDAGVNAR